MKRNDRSRGPDPRLNMNQGRDQAEAARALSCNIKGLATVNERDPLNPTNTISGYMCKDEGTMFGSMLITRVNGETLPRSLIVYGMPSIQDVNKATGQNKDPWRPAQRGPSEGRNGGSSNFSSFAPSSSSSQSSGPTHSASGSNDPNSSGSNNYNNPWTMVEASSRIFIANKWNGFNITVYKYQDAKGTTFVTAMPRGQATLQGEMLQAFCTHLQIPLESNGSATSLKGGSTQQLTSIFQILEQPEIQGATYELIGKQFAQLVAYDFDLRLQPLFATTSNGTMIPQALLSANIAPVIDASGLTEMLASDDEKIISGEFGPYDFDSDLLSAFSRTYRPRALQINKNFRDARGLKEGYRTEHFLTEGKIIYLLNDYNGTVSRSSLIKVKPNDISKSHVEMIDTSLMTLLFESLEKLYGKGLQATPAALQAEMQLSDRAWSRLGAELLWLVACRPNFTQSAVRKNPKVLIVMGLPGSGKSTIANKLSKLGWVRVNQDEMGNRKAVEANARNALQRNQNVVIDRCNIDFDQRLPFLELAHKAGVTDVRCLWIDTPAQVCKDRVSVRKDHPTIPMGDFGHGIIDRFTSSLAPPMRGEGFCEIVRTSTDAEVDAALEKFGLLAQS